MIVVTHFQFSTGAATAMNGFLHDEDDNKIVGPVYLEAVAGRGYVSGPICKRLVANKALEYTSSAAIAQSVTVEYEIWKV